MGSLLRSTGGEVVVGLMGIAVAMLSLGLAIVALDEGQSITPGAYVAFSTAGLFALLFFVAWGYLWRCEQTRTRKIREIGGFAREGQAVRNAIMHGPAPDDPVNAYEQWASAVLSWLEENEPDHLPAFASAAPGATVQYFLGNAAKSLAINDFDAHLAALVNILRDVRTAP